MPNSVGQSFGPGSTRGKGLRLCYTGLGGRVHVLDGSGGCGIRPDEGREATLEPKGSGGRKRMCCGFTAGERTGAILRWTYSGQHVRVGLAV